MPVKIINKADPAARFMEHAEELSPRRIECDRGIETVQHPSYEVVFFQIQLEYRVLDSGKDEANIVCIYEITSTHPAYLISAQVSH